MASRNRRLRDLSRLPPEELVAVGDAFIKSQHPITTAILGAVMVEHGLEQLLRSTLKHKDDKTWAMLTADNGPLRPFYCKIAMGYALGAYDDSVRSDLTIVRTIRNAFAHSKKLIKFDHPAVVAALRKATTSSALPKGLDERRLYINLCLRLTLKLMRIHLQRMGRITYNPFDFLLKDH